MSDILLMIIFIIILFIIILLFIGVKIALIYDKTGSNFKGCLDIYVLRKIKVYSTRFPSSEKKEDEEEKGETEILELAKPCFEDFKIFLKSFVKCIRVEKLENHLVFGLDSYVETAKYIGYIWGLLVIVNEAHENAMLSAEPSFNGSVFDLNGDNELEINLLKLIPPTLRLMSKKEVQALIRGVIHG